MHESYERVNKFTILQWPPSLLLVSSAKLACPSGPYLGVDVSVVVHEALHNLSQSPLAGHVQRGGELALDRDGTRGAVHVRSRANEEACGGCVLE